MKLNDNFVMRTVYGKTVLMPVKNNTTSNDPILLNSTASTIIMLANECLDADELCNKSLDAFGISSNTPEGNQIQSFITMLIAKGIISSLER